LASYFVTLPPSLPPHLPKREEEKEEEEGEEGREERTRMDWAGGICICCID